MDDIQVMGESLQQHIDKLRQILSKLQEYNIKIEPNKCELHKHELTYLGRVVTEDGVKPDHRKIKALTEFPIPKSEKDVKPFLRLSGYYRNSQFNLAQYPDIYLTY